MNDGQKEKAERLYKEHKAKKRIRTRLVTAAIVIASLTSYMMIFPAAALENKESVQTEAFTEAAEEAAEETAEGSTDPTEIPESPVITETDAIEEVSSNTYKEIVDGIEFEYGDLPLVIEADPDAEDIVGPETTEPQADIEIADNSETMTFSSARMMKAFATSSPNTAADWSETDPDDNGLNVNKYAEANDDGSYTITIEQWLDGMESKAPLDIVMVIDVSGSMQDVFYDHVYASTIDTSKAYYVSLNTTSGSTMYRVSYCKYCGQWYVTGKDASEEHYTNYYRYGAGYVKTFYHAYYKTYGAFTPKASDTSTSGYYFYELFTGKLTDLQNAANGFINIIADAAVTDEVDHRISIVKFADGMTSAIGNNTGTFESESGTYTGNYTQIVKTMRSANTYRNDLISAINSFDPAGSTRTDYAMCKAKEVIDSDTSSNKKIVVLFTDGEPQDPMGNLKLDWDASDVAVANSAILYSNQLKADDVDVFTIGLLDGLDDSVPASTTAGTTTREKNSTFLHYLSSNYPNASSMTSGGTCAVSAYGSRFFYGTSDSAELEEIFAMIATRVVQSASLSLPADTIFRDSVTKYFDFDADTVSCYTREYDGNSFGDAKTSVSMTLNTKDRDGETILDFSGWSPEDNYISQTDKGSGDYGRLLGMTFKVWPKDEFIGGNAVLTNDSDSGVYKPGQAEAVDYYPEPEVNVPIAELQTSIVDKHLYLLDSMSKAETEEGASFGYIGRRSGNVYELSFADDGSCLCDWEDDYALVTKEIKDSAGEEISDSTYLYMQDDDTFSAFLTAEPIYDPAESSGGALLSPNRDPGAAAVKKAAEDKANIYVYLPEMTFKDMIVSFGQDEPTKETYLTEDYVSRLTAWKHSDTAADPAIMLHDEPIPELEFTTDPDSVLNGKINTVHDIPVSVRAFIGNEEITADTTFLHSDCNQNGTCVRPDCTWADANADGTGGDPAFLLHVQAGRVLPETGGSGKASAYAAAAAVLAMTAVLSIRAKRRQKI